MGSCFCLFLLDWCSPLLSFALLPYFPTIARVGRDGRVYEVLSFHLNSRTSRVVSRFFSLDFSFPFSFLLLLLLPPRPLSSAVLLAAVQPVAPNSSSDTALSITPSNSALFPLQFPFETLIPKAQGWALRSGKHPASEDLNTSG